MWKATSTRCQAFICTDDEHHSPTTGYQIAELSESITAWSAGHTIWGLCWGRMSVWITGHTIDVSHSLSIFLWKLWKLRGLHWAHTDSMNLCFIYRSKRRQRSPLCSNRPSFPVSSLPCCSVFLSVWFSHEWRTECKCPLALCLGLFEVMCHDSTICILVLQHLCWILTQVTGCGIHVGYTQNTIYKWSKLSQ